MSLELMTLALLAPPLPAELSHHLYTNVLQVNNFN